LPAGFLLMRIVDLLERDASLYADRSAVEIVGGARLTYRELRERVTRIAGGLAESGVSRGDRIAVMAGNGLLFFDVYLAAAYLGAAAVPINSHLTAPEAAFQLRHSEPALAFADAAHAEVISAALPPEVELVVEDSPAHRRLCAAAVPAGVDARARAEDTALLIYTSGTTGRPKGVCLSQASLAFNGVTIALAQRLQPGHVFLTSTPLHHVATGTRVVSMLLDGQCHVVMPAFRAEEWLDVVAERGVESAVLVPTQLRRVLDAQAARPRDLSSLRLLVYGAAPTAVPTIRRAMGELDCGLYQGYGLSEACTNLTALMPEDHTPEADGRGLLQSCGRPVPGVQVRIDGAETGEILVRTDKVMSGYWRDPEATAGALADGWLRTGDIGRLTEDGYLFILDRARDVIISGGVNIYPSEVEAVLEDHPAVQEAAVVGQPDSEWGERPVAFLVGQAGALADEAELLAWCRERLAGFKLPRRLTFVDELPRTSNGKVRKLDLREPRRG
jgi:long-chain acyl-CoA synthetase